ncbi:MAG: ABC transporter ATP-binding protein [Clostridiales bacterium]|nr:ABC transporter ATP-binding protein [Clostridiales bacterium]
METLEEKNKLKGTKNLRKYFSYFKYYKFYCIMFWLLLVISGVISFLAPIFLGKVITSMTVTADFKEAWKWALIFALLEFVGLIFILIRVPFFKKLENNVKKKVKLDIIKNSFNINIGEYENLGNGLFVTRLTKDLDGLATSFKTISELIVSFLSKAGFIVYVSIANIWIGLFLITFIIIRYFIYQIRIHYYAKLKPDILKKGDEINSVVGESIRGIKDIKTLGLSSSVLSRIGFMQNEYARKDNKEWYIGSFLCTIANVITVIYNLLFICLAIWLIQIGQLELAIFYTIYVYKNSVIDFAVQLGDLQNYFKDMEVASYRVFELMDESKYKHDKFGSLVVENFQGNIEFKDVTFEYTRGENIINNINFKIEPNTHVAFVGESGCGKSTIVALICKLYDPTAGKIMFDGHDSMELSQSFGENVSMINQFPYVFNMTIRENMQLVKPEVTDREIYQALKLANADEFVKALPQKLDSFLGEGGTRLSGGQKQRICIARALLKNSKIIIFDEATSALDNLSQEKVMENVEELKKNHTIITIAHRLSTIEDCDVIYFIKNGQIVCFGTHLELMEKNAQYRNLYHKQKKEAEINEEIEKQKEENAQAE